MKRHAPLCHLFSTVESKYKKGLTDETFVEFALAIGKGHCQQLGSALKLSERDIDQRNKENLEVLFRTTDMILEWYVKQSGSVYKKRCQLRKVALATGCVEVAGI